jgi:hypothetical protein
MFLTPAEIHELTGKTRKPAQRRALNTMGIEHKVRPDGAVIVSRSHIENVLDGNAVTKVRKRVEPNWKNV